MEDEIQNQESEKNYTLPVSILISAVILAGAWVYTDGLKVHTSQKSNASASSKKTSVSALEEKVLPPEGVILPVAWNDLGAKLVSVGVIDANKFKNIYEERGTFTDEYKNLLLGRSNNNPPSGETGLKITKANAGYLLNLFWALGLASKNPILDSGEMKNPIYNRTSPPASKFASTAGWTIAEGNPMDHYSRHLFFNLSSKQQALVDKVSRGIYRPCCNNSTNFPDCNHGMAMLGLLELMASQGVSEEDLWETALSVNSYWFPDTYLTIAAYMKNKGIDWKDVNPREILGADFSSANGFAKVASQVIEPRGQGEGGGCGVDAGESVTPQRRQGGCGI